MQQTITNQKAQTTNATQKLRRDKAKNALLETKVSLEIAAYEVSKLIDEFSKAIADYIFGWALASRPLILNQVVLGKMAFVKALTEPSEIIYLMVNSFIA